MSFSRVKNVAAASTLGAALAFGAVGVGFAAFDSPAVAAPSDASDNGGDESVIEVSPSDGGGETEVPGTSITYPNAAPSDNGGDETAPAPSDGGGDIIDGEAISTPVEVSPSDNGGDEVINVEASDGGGETTVPGESITYPNTAPSDNGGASDNGGDRVAGTPISAPVKHFNDGASAKTGGSTVANDGLKTPGIITAVSAAFAGLVAAASAVRTRMLKAQSKN